MSFGEDEMNTLLYYIQENAIVLPLCDFVNSKIFQDLKYFEAKESASDTNVFFSKILLPNLNASPIALKTWIGWNDLSKEQAGDMLLKSVKKYNEDQATRQDIKDILDKCADKRKYEGLDYEKNLYEFITKNIILKGLSNAFIPFIASGSCLVSDIYDKIAVSKKLNITQKHALLQKLKFFQFFPELKLNLIATGSFSSSKLMDLYDFLQDDKIKFSTSDIASIILQVLQALFVMEKFKIMHNDLHLGNIFLEMLDEPRKISIPLSDKARIEFPSKYVVKIFDWDRAWCKKLGPNPMLETESYLSVDVTQKFRQNQDYYQFICGLKEKSKNPEKKLILEEVLHTILPDPNFNAWRSAEDDLFKIKLTSTQKSKLQSLRFNERPYAKLKYASLESSRFLLLFGDIISSSQLPLEYRKRIFSSSSVYFGVDRNEEYIYILPNRRCIPSYTFSDDLLYPLKDFFGNFNRLNDLLNFIPDHELIEENEKV